MTGGLAFLGETSRSPNWLIGNDNYAFGDWGVYVSTGNANGVAGSQKQGETTAPLVPRLYIDPAGRVTVGHSTLIDQPGGTSTFNVEGSITVGSSGNSMARVRHGLVKLAGGSATIQDTTVTMDSRIMLTAQSLEGVSIPEALAIKSRIPGVSFTIKSAASHDASWVAWEMIEPDPAN